MTRTLLLAAALVAASPALADCPDPWPPQAATREQVRAALGADPCGTDGTVPVQPIADGAPAPSPALGPMPRVAETRTYSVPSESGGEPVQVRVNRPPPTPPPPQVINRTYNTTTTIYRDRPVYGGPGPYPGLYRDRNGFSIDGSPVYRNRQGFRVYHPETYGGGYHGRRW